MYGSAKKTVNWPKFYEGRDGEEYRYYVKRQYGPFLDEIARQVDHYPMRSKVLLMELGIGTGSITANLVERLPGCLGHIGVDYLPDMLTLAQRRFDRLNQEVTLILNDIRNMPTPGPEDIPLVVHSHGVLEHYPDEVIQNIVWQYPASVPQVHYMPGNRHGAPSYGDERLLPLQHWIDLLKPSRAITFNEGKDYAIVINGV